jgi:DNA-directed RNA polymerase subunit M/transcription elongation factor TFIIS
MKFCKECNNKLYLIEDNEKLMNLCNDCGFKEEFTDSIIEKRVYKTSQVTDTEKNKYLIYDNTLPHTIHKICPNQECPVKKDDPNLQEAVFITDKVTLKITFICKHCNTEWKY